MLNPQEVFAVDEQTGARQQKMNVRHPSGVGVFDRNDGDVGQVFLHHVHRLFKGFARQIILPGINILRGDVRVGTGHALINDFKH